MHLAIYQIFFPQNQLLSAKLSMIESIGIKKQLFVIFWNYSQKGYNYFISASIIEDSHFHIVSFLNWGALHFFFLIDWRFVAILPSGKSRGTFFLTVFVHFVSVSHIGIACNISNFVIVIIFIVMICNQWPLMLLF